MSAKTYWSVQECCWVESPSVEAAPAEAGSVEAVSVETASAEAAVPQQREDVAAQETVDA